MNFKKIHYREKNFIFCANLEVLRWKHQMTLKTQNLKSAQKVEAHILSAVFQLV